MFMMGFLVFHFALCLHYLFRWGSGALDFCSCYSSLIDFWQVSVFLFVRIPFVLTSFVITGVGCYKSRKYICNSFLVLQAGYF